MKCKHGNPTFCEQCFAEENTHPGEPSYAALATSELRRELARTRLVDALRLARIAVADYCEADPRSHSTLGVLDSAAEVALEGLEPAATEPSPPPEEG